MKILKRSVSSFLLFSLIACNNDAATQSITINAFEKELKNAETQLLDVRSIEEYNAGHLPNALQADWNNDAEFAKRTKALDKSKTVLVYCLSGARSNSAMQWLYSNGFKKVYNLQGGINKWKQANKSVEKGIEVAQINVESFKLNIVKYDEVFVDFGAPWCPPCKKMESTIDSLQKVFTVIKINVSEQEEISKAFSIEEMPTLIYYKKGVEVFRNKGIIDCNAIITKTKK
jgi:rhodanese-related sulfurtransferase/glutaredoxin